MINYDKNMNDYFFGPERYKGYCSRKNNDFLALLVIKILVMLYSRSVRVIENKVGEKLLKKQRQRGKPESVPFYSVTIPKEIRKYIGHTESTGTKKRLHWVRSHIRTLHDGRKVPVVAHLRGMGNQKIINKYYDVL